MDTLYLERFLIVADQKSFTKAANKLFLSTSTVSKSVVYLEESLGVKLLNRSNQSVELTKCGELLVERGKDLIQEISQLKSDLSQLVERSGYTLNIFRMAAFSPAFLSAYRSYSTLYPEDIVQIYTHSPIGVSKALESGLADAGLVVDSADSWNRQGFSVRVIAQEPFCAVVSANHALSDRSSISADDLVQEKILEFGPIKTGYSESVAEAHGRLTRLLSEKRTNIVTFNNDETLMFQLRAGLGVRLMGKSSAMELYPDMRHIELSGFDTGIQVFFVWKEINGNPALKRFLELL
ncbi:MAG: LysR family transcriptional regulator [Oscillospiraceae bacterium]|nr:LysR family transcriptional regulator [Oscillospiraceae bacterium]